MAEKLLDSGPKGKVVKTYLILVGMATRRQTTRYGYLADETGVATRAVGGLCLDPIYQFCQENGFPDLTCIVVRQDTGEPGYSHVGMESLYRNRERVYDFPWLDFAPPTMSQLEAMASD